MSQDTTSHLLGEGRKSRLRCTVGEPRFSVGSILSGERLPCSFVPVVLILPSDSHSAIWHGMNSLLRSADKPR